MPPREQGSAAFDKEALIAFLREHLELEILCGRSFDRGDWSNDPGRVRVRLILDGETISEVSDSVDIPEITVR